MATESKTGNASRSVFFISFTVLLLLVGTAYGILIGKYQYWPHDSLTEIRTIVVSLQKYGKITPPGRTRNAPANAPREIIKIYRPDQLANGYYAVMGWSDADEHYVIWLFDQSGNKRHTWVLDYLGYDPDGPLNKSETPHGLQVLEDGSVVVNFDDGDILTRLDSCGNPLWVKQGVFHHSISRNSDGSMWTWRGENTAYGHYQYLVRFDPDDGSTLREIGLIEDVLSHSDKNLMTFALSPGYTFRHLDSNPPDGRGGYDIFHPNDLEELSPDLAPLFPDFNAGDLLMSFRETNLLAVLDPISFEVKWAGNGPWRKQHDPDFTVNGNITIYDNNPNRSGSRILTLEPATGKVTNTMYGGDLAFSSPAMGKQQLLPNGNHLVVSPGEGRMLEVTATGQRVLEFNNVMNEKYNNHVENGIWLPEDYFEEFPSCAP